MDKHINIKANTNLTLIASDSIAQNYNFNLEQNSTLNFVLIIAGANSTEQTININLVGQNSSAKVRGLYLLQDNQKVVINTLQNHLNSNTNSDLIFKGCLFGNSSSNYIGKIFVDKNGKQTQASQYNKNLLFSDTATAISIPSLEVLTNDVVCKHGSATGNISKELLFYLQSRGLDYDIAKKVLIRSFIADVICDLDEQVKEKVYNLI